jgi:carbamoyltransferase
LFGGPPRPAESPILQVHMDLAASIQAVAEEVILRIGRYVHQRTGMRRLVMAGGVALNCVANARLLRDGPFDQIWIQPAAGDAGGALGAALFVWHQLLENGRDPDPHDAQQGSFLGPSYSSDQIERLLTAEQADFERLPDDDLFPRIAAQLADGKVVGWFQGRMEFGPRALGARSILGDPRSPAMQSQMNLKVKFRESFRPFAPAVLAEHAAEWFGFPAGGESPYMLLIAPVREDRRTPVEGDLARIMAEDPDLCRRVNIPRSSIPAVTHVDHTARLQTVDAVRHPRFHRLLREFHRRTGCPVLVNTSFNIRGEPIVCTPEDAYRCFRATDIDLLVLENHVIGKKSNAGASEAERERYRARFAPD